jgi:hypothetical protein
VADVGAPSELSLTPQHKIKKYKRLLTRIQEVLISNPFWGIGYPDRGFGDFTQSLCANAGIVTPLGHYRFLPKPFQFIYHQLSYHSTLQPVIDTDSIVSDKD